MLAESDFMCSLFRIWFNTDRRIKLQYLTFHLEELDIFIFLKEWCIGPLPGVDSGPRVNIF